MTAGWGDLGSQEALAQNPSGYSVCPCPRIVSRRNWKEQHTQAAQLERTAYAGRLLAKAETRKLEPPQQSFRNQKTKRKRETGAAFKKPNRELYPSVKFVPICRKPFFQKSRPSRKPQRISNDSTPQVKPNRTMATLKVVNTEP